MLSDRKQCNKQRLSYFPFALNSLSPRYLLIEDFVAKQRPQDRRIDIIPSGQQRMSTSFFTAWAVARIERRSDRCIAYRLQQKIIRGCPATPWNKKDGAFHSPLRTDKTVQKNRLMSIYLIAVDRALNTSISDLSNTRRIVCSRVTLVCCPVWIWRLCSAGCLGKNQAKETAIIVLQDGVPDRTGEVF